MQLSGILKNNVMQAYDINYIEKHLIVYTAKDKILCIVFVYIHVMLVLLIKDIFTRNWEQ